MKFAIFSVVVFVVLLGACAYQQPASTEGEPLPYASRYRALHSVATLLDGATVLTGTGERLDGADV